MNLESSELTKKYTEADLIKAQEEVEEAERKISSFPMNTEEGRARARGAQELWREKHTKVSEITKVLRQN